MTDETKSTGLAEIRTDVPITIRNGVKARFVSFNGLSDSLEHVALVFGNALNQDAPLTRLHSQCLTGDVFGSLRCDCGAQLDEAVEVMDKNGGIILYLIQEGRGIGLYNKLDAYEVQIRDGMDTYDANRHIGQPLDARDYTAAAQMLSALKVIKINLLSNNPDKAQQLESCGVVVEDIISTRAHVTGENLKYLEAKRDRSGHKLSLEKTAEESVGAND